VLDNKLYEQVGSFNYLGCRKGFESHSDVNIVTCFSGNVATRRMLII
jgi:hypothetical protein